MYYIPNEPPYFILVAGLLVALTSGTAFAAMLKGIAQKWTSNQAADAVVKFQTRQLIIPFLGMTAGVGMFLSSGLSIFGFPTMLACAVGVPLTLLTGLLVWFQLGSMLALAEREGVEAFKIDMW